MTPANELLTSWETTLRGDPGATAMCFGNDAVSRSALDLLSRRHSSTLQDLGLARGRLLGLALPNGPDWLAWLLAAWRAGLVVVPLEPPSPLPAEDLGLALMADSHGLRRLPGTARRRAALLKLTSGSTGRPRALPFSAAALAADGRNLIAGMKISPNDSALACLPFSHSYGFGNFVLPLLLQGTPVVLAPSPLPSALRETARLHRPRVLPLVPPLVRLLATAPGDPADFASLRLVLCAGGRLLPSEAETFRRRWGHPVANFYGSSETGGICFAPDSGTLTENSVGFPLPGVNLAISPSGRVRVASRAVLGHTGHLTLPDLGRLEPDGSLTLLGRAGRTFKIGGRRLEPAEIEAALALLPGVREVRVIPITGRRGEPEITALVESDLPAATLCESLRLHLPAWKIPTMWKVSPALPRTARGKADWAKTQCLAQGIGPVHVTLSMPISAK